MKPGLGSAGLTLCVQVRASFKVHVALLKLLNSAHLTSSHLFSTKMLPSFVKTRCSDRGQACPAASLTPPSPAHLLYLLGAPGLRNRNLEVQYTPVSIYKSNSSHMGSRANGPRHGAEDGVRDTEKGPCPGDSSGCHHASLQTQPLHSHPLSPLWPSRAQDAASPSQTRFLQILFNRQSSDLQRALQSGARSPPHPTKHSLTHPLLNSSGPGKGRASSVPHSEDVPL